MYVCLSGITFFFFFHSAFRLHRRSSSAYTYGNIAQSFLYSNSLCDTFLRAILHQFFLCVWREREISDCFESIRNFISSSSSYLCLLQCYYYLRSFHQALFFCMYTNKFLFQHFFFFLQLQFVTIFNFYSHYCYDVKLDNMRLKSRFLGINT